MKKLSLCFSLFVIILISVSAIQPNATYKNLQILPQNISEDSLDMYMEMFSEGLGVNCAFCHVKIDENQWDMASDEKEEKEVTRHMLRMMFDINKNYFSFENESGSKPLVVTCITCHKGRPHIEKAEKDNY